MRNDPAGPESTNLKPGWLPFGVIVAASALAHLWCLQSQFYLDDFPQILDNDIVRSGQFWQKQLNAWTYFFYALEYKLFGLSSVGFHAVNWLLHTSVACVVFAFGRDFLRARWTAGVPWFGALLFAVHPLGSEIPNYVRTQDLAWVTLFSLLSAWGLLSFLRERGWRLHPPGPGAQIPIFRRSRRRWGWLALGVVSLAGATFSKGPGIFHALMAMGVIGFALVPRSAGGSLWKRLWLVPAGFALLGVTLWLLGLLQAGLGIFEQWSNPRFLGHAFTVSRVFWEFAWRCLIPVKLSADHQIAETLIPAGAHFWNIPDSIAQLAAVGMLATAGTAAWLAWRKSTRLFGICLLLFTGSILFRVFYLIPEFMPEYRIYPGLPWFCLGAAIALTAAWRWMFSTVSPQIPAAILLAVFAVISARRSFQWHDMSRLMADVLQQYPAQARALWELNDRDLRDGKWPAIIDRQERDFPEVRRRFISSIAELAPRRELPSGNFSLAEVACVAHYAVAVAHEKSPAQGLIILNQLEAYMHGLNIKPATNPTHWWTFKRDKARVLEAAGDYQEALRTLEEPGSPPLWPHDYKRISRKLVEKPAK